MLLACGGSEPATPPAFDGPRAFRDLAAQVAIGPRPAGSSAAARTRALIEERLRQAGWTVEPHAFRARPPGLPELEMVNLIGRRVGVRPDERILVVTHYDTKAIEGIEFVGANDGASGVALLLELARQLSSRELSRTVELVFFDGEEAFGPSISDADGLYGSRAFVARETERGTFGEIRALLLVDMIADRDLNLSLDLNSHPELREIVAEEAQRLGIREILGAGTSLRLVDDHTPFLRRGLREVIAFIDFEYGARRSPGPYWHSERDNLAAVSAESLNRLGQLVVETFHRIEARLERAPRP